MNHRARITVYLRNTSNNRVYSYMKYVDLPFIATDGMALQLKGMDTELRVRDCVYREEAKDNLPYFDVSLYSQDGAGLPYWWDATQEQIDKLITNGFILEQEF